MIEAKEQSIASLVQKNEEKEKEIEQVKSTMSSSETETMKLKEDIESLKQRQSEL